MLAENGITSAPYGQSVKKLKSNKNKVKYQ